MKQPEYQEYLIKGNTYIIKEDLMALKCTFNGITKCWKTKPLTKDGVVYLRLKSLVEAVDGEIMPANLSGDAKKIQDILNRR